MTNKFDIFDFPEAELVKNSDLFRSCTNIVIGKGNPRAEILFVGEAPGRNEDLQGFPFVGAAGKNLDKLLEKVGLTLDNIYVANILKCRPPENRGPQPEEIRAHTPWLIKQIREMKPKVVCSLGNYATKFFLAKGNVDEMENQAGITSVHGKVKEIVFDGLNIKLIPLFHPAAIIYNQKLLPLWEADMEVVKRETENKNVDIDKEKVEQQKKLFG
ncbi:MAG: uracil-DNA glycosylase [Candidatus Pacearchaeota archaeon]